ncbi:MAG TPA: ATP-binding protein [Paludibacter sp.]
MKEFTIEQKQALRDAIIAMQEASGLSGNEFATKRLGFTNGSKFSHIKNNWDKPGMVGQDTWEAIEKYIESANRYKLVATANLKKGFECCEMAYNLKKFIPLIGNSGDGKTTSLVKYKEHIERNKRFKVVYFKATKGTQKQFITGLMEAIGCYQHGTTAFQLETMREYAMRQDMLLLIDEVSVLEGHSVTILKEVMTYFLDVCGIVLAGTPYFFKNLIRGSNRDRHLFKETKDRLFYITFEMSAPTENEAEEIFRANNITDKETLNILMNKIADPKKRQALRSRSWLAKQSFRGIADCVDMIRATQMSYSIDYNALNL